MARLDQLPGALDLRLIAGRPFTFTATCTGATVTSPVLTMISGQSDVVAVGAPDVSVSNSVITVAWSASDTTALAALKPPGRSAAFRYDLSALVDGLGPFSLLARNFTVEPVGTATTGTQTASATLAFEVGGADVSIALTLSGGAGAAWLSGAGAPSGATGEPGDWYINTSNGDAYEKTGVSTWTSRVNLKGPTGDTGAAGSAGATGPQGPSGSWATALLISTVSGSTDTLSAADLGYTIRYTNAAQVAVTIPTDVSEDLVDGFWCALFAEGAGGLTLSTTGITLAGATPNRTIAQNEMMVVVKTASANTWIVVGGSSA